MMQTEEKGGSHKVTNLLLQNLNSSSTSLYETEKFRRIVRLLETWKEAELKDKQQ